MSKRNNIIGYSASGVNPLVNNLVAWYDYNNNALDALGVHNGTAVGTPTYVSGVIDNAINFGNNTSLNYVTVPDSDDFSFTNGVNDLPFSFSFWVNNQAISPTGNWYINKRVGGNEEYQILWFNATSQVVITLCSLGNVTNRIEAFSAVNPFALNTWNHVVVTYDGSGLAAGLNIYVNGVNVTSSRTTTGTYVRMANGTALFYMGIPQFSINANLKHRGYMDLVGVWKDRELTLSDVTELYNGGAGITYPF